MAGWSDVGADLVAGQQVAHSPAKRRRPQSPEDTGKHQKERVSARDSCRTEPMDNGVQPDPFTTVTYAKNRAGGIPILFRPASTDGSFWKVNPNTVASDVRSLSQQEVLSYRFHRNGSFFVPLRLEAAARNLLSASSLAGIPALPSVPKSYARNMGKVYDVRQEYSNDDLVLYFKEAGVTSARRQVRHSIADDGRDLLTSLRSVILTFQPTVHLHQVITLGFQKLQVHEYVEGPLQCYNCQRFGHMARNCRGTTKCGICAWPHRRFKCNAKREPKWANCGSAHPAPFSLRPVKTGATVRHQKVILRPKVEFLRSDSVHVTNVPDVQQFPELSLRNDPVDLGPEGISTEVRNTERQRMSPSRSGQIRRSYAEVTEKTNVRRQSASLAA